MSSDSSSSGVQFPAMDATQFAAFFNQITAIQSHISKSANPSQDPTNPYFILPSESPGIPLTSVVLTGSNYGAWSRAMLLALKSKNKLKFIDGSIEKPDSSDPLFEAWERCNTYVVGWLNLSLSPDIYQSVLWNNLAYEIWDELKHRYYQGDKFRVAELYEEVYALRQGDMNVTNYYTKLKSLWEEIDNFRIVPQCNCDKRCSCALSVIRKQREEDKVTKFLRGLNDQHSTV
ncbi:uncharacterized protein [Arachis hypogaea]|uniref:uncharacterized protein n=1 Tax=Arachis hypogaea TaxID=3818 RepID=UPI000A2C31AA|nr:uncharacterized protein LOC112717421 [Arachis hypogaea]